MKKPSVAIVGYGNFGRFMARHLKPYCRIVPIRKESDPEHVSECSAIIFAVPAGGLEKAVKKIKPHVTLGTYIIDVTSVKQKPLKILQTHFPRHEILGTHPIFGPQSGRNGVVGLSIVVCNVSFTPAHYTAARRFLSTTLKLCVIEQSPAAHDRDMARVQALTHLIGRALGAMDMKSYRTGTASYGHLLELVRLLSHDSWELFSTIQNSNTYARAVRSTFIRETLSLDKKLK